MKHRVHVNGSQYNTEEALSSRRQRHRSIVRGIIGVAVSNNQCTRASLRDNLSHYDLSALKCHGLSR